MKILIFTATTGDGHNQAARNLKYELEKDGIEVKVVYLFKGNTKKSFTSSFFDKGQTFLVKNMPQTYSMIYNTAHYKLTQDIMRKLMVSSKNRIRVILKEENPDLIISTHPYSVPLVFSQIKKYRMNIPFVQVVTDFDAHYIYIDQEIDAYITGIEFTNKTLIEKGIDKEKIHLYGIPIRKIFSQTKRNNLDKFSVLIMGGGMGLEGIKDCSEIILNSNLDLYLNIVCGKNEELKLELENKYASKISEGKLKVYGFTDKINEIMDNSSLIITKPGGLTSTEAITKRLPMLLPFYIPGQEKENVDILTETGLAIEVKELEDLPNMLLNLLNNKEEYNKLVENMDKLANNYSMDKVIELVHKLKKK